MKLRVGIESFENGTRMRPVQEGSLSSLDQSEASRSRNAREEADSGGLFALKSKDEKF